MEGIAYALSFTHAKYIWLKMNPIKTGAYFLGKMLVANKNIELLDLFNTGLCNNGFKEFVKGISEELKSDAIKNNLNGLKHFKHLYLSINLLDKDSCYCLSLLLQIMTNLESLYIGFNPWEDSGFEIMADSIKILKNLKRFGIGSSSLTDRSLPILKDIVKECSNLTCLDLGSYKSTNYFDQGHNKFTNYNLLTDIGELIKKNSDDVYLGLRFCYVGENTDTLIDNLTNLKVNTDLKNNNLKNTEKKNLNTNNIILRRLKHPVALDYIESIYRNEMGTIDS